MQNVGAESQSYGESTAMSVLAVSVICAYRVWQALKEAEQGGMIG